MTKPSTPRQGLCCLSSMITSTFLCSGWGSTAAQRPMGGTCSHSFPPVSQVPSAPTSLSGQQPWARALAAGVLAEEVSGFGLVSPWKGEAVAFIIFLLSCLLLDRWMNEINCTAVPSCNGMNQIPPKAKTGAGFISSLKAPTHISQSVLLCLFLAVAKRAVALFFSVPFVALALE